MADPKPCPASIIDFIKIPDQSIAELWVEGDDTELAAGALAETAAGTQKFRHAQVFRPAGGNNAARATLTAPEITILTVFVSFTKKATAIVNLKILTPGGGTHAFPVRCALGGAKGAEARRIFVCKTVQS